MRIDKYLWCVRVFKTRSLSSESCRSGRVTVGEAEYKPAREIREGDEIVVRKGAVHFAYKVLAIPKSRVGAKLVPDYCEDITPAEEIEKLEMIRLNQRQTLHRKPGRPSKKDRRDLDKFFE